LEDYDSVKDLVKNNSQEVSDAIAEQYGVGATIDKDGVVTKNGQEVATLTVEEIKSLIAS
jgi:hypothetical protein